MDGGAWGLQSMGLVKSQIPGLEQLEMYTQGHTLFLGMDQNPLFP